MFFWLKEGAESKLDAKELSIKTHRTGTKYVDVYGGIDEPIVGVPSIPKELIERITLKDSIHRGFRTEGVYRHNGATLVVKGSSYWSGLDKIECQDITAGASTISALVAIYTLVRQGKLSPEENWGERTPTNTPLTESGIPSVVVPSSSENPPPDSTLQLTGLVENTSV